MNGIIKCGKLYRDLAERNEVIPMDSDESWINCKSIVINNEIHDSDFRYVHYISDIHLDNKILKSFPNGCSDVDILCYIRDIVSKMYDGSDASSDLLLIAGDISQSKVICDMFLAAVKTHYEAWNVIYVLGNHELWEMVGSSLTLSEVQSDYDKISRRNEAVLLECSVLAFKKDKHILINYDNLEKADNQELRNLLVDVNLIILGGTGFAANNEKYNANSEIYRGTIGREEEIELSNRFNSLYERLVKIASDLNVIVLTHMPKEDWGSDEYVPNWIYVNGHTHRNQLILNDKKSIYADNQIGYTSESIYLKRFLVDYTYDSFRDYEDGIHLVSHDQYRDFYSGLWMSVTMNRKGQIILLKRSGLYFFLFRNDKGNLMVLNGGAISKAKHDVDYYYNHMAEYADNLRSFFDDYNSKLNELSDAVKRIGGLGNIHGCIVDVSFYDHLYFNPVDRKVTPYHAIDIIEKYVYDSVPSLLANNNLLCFENIKQEDNLPDEWKSKPTKQCELCESTEMYRYSRIIRGYQYCTENNIIRRWDDTILKKRCQNNAVVKNEHSILSLLE